MPPSYYEIKIHLFHKKFAPDGYCGSPNPEKLAEDPGEVNCLSCLKKWEKRGRLAPKRTKE